MSPDCYRGRPLRKFKMNSMKNRIMFTLAATIVFSLTSCDSNDDDGTMPELINQEEVITTVQLSLRSVVDGTSVIYSSVDADGDGPNEPVITNTGFLAPDTDYTGSVTFLNETVSPAEDITEEVEEEADEHQVFYTPNSTLLVTVAPSNFDSDNNVLGTQFTLRTGISSLGTLTVTLRHEPVKPNNGTLDSAGGETDVQVIFPVMVQ